MEEHAFGISLELSKARAQEKLSKNTMEAATAAGRVAGQAVGQAASMASSVAKHDTVRRTAQQAAAVAKTGGAVVLAAGGKLQTGLERTIGANNVRKIEDGAQAFFGAAHNKLGSYSDWFLKKAKNTMSTVVASAQDYNAQDSARLFRHQGGESGGRTETAVRREQGCELDKEEEEEEGLPPPALTVVEDQSSPAAATTTSTTAAAAAAVMPENFAGAADVSSTSVSRLDGRSAAGWGTDPAAEGTGDADSDTELEWGQEGGKGLDEITDVSIDDAELDEELHKLGIHG